MNIRNFKLTGRCVYYGYAKMTVGYLKNHLTKQKPVCTNFLCICKSDLKILTLFFTDLKSFS